MSSCSRTHAHLAGIITPPSGEELRHRFGRWAQRRVWDAQEIVAEQKKRPCKK